jgi:pimeloyl-ACP methyl ester carboxylesterase
MPQHNLEHFRTPQSLLQTAERHPVVVGIAASLAALAVAAIVNNGLARGAEHDTPPTGRFIEVDGVRLHYVERGSGEPLVLLHGNGSMIQDFETSGLLDLAARSYRTIAFDRPGFGHSSRPRGALWTPQAQADLIRRALAMIGVTQAVVLGHSWGASVAVALALRHPNAVKALVLASGYYYPSVRADVVPLSGPAVPIIGDVIGHTIAPLISRAAWTPATRKMFAPAPVPRKFDRFPKEMAFRPSQIHASAEETAMMIPEAFAMQKHYGELKMPVVIIAGEGDRLIDIDDQSARLHDDIAQSALHRVAGVGHMVHQSAPDRVMAAINEAAGPVLAPNRAAVARVAA